MKRLLIPLLAILALGGCNEPPPEEGVQRIDNVVRVFMHEPHRYTLLTQNPDSTVVRQLTLEIAANRCYRNMELIMDMELSMRADVPEDEPMWAEYIWCGGPGKESYEMYLVSLHFHAVQNLHGGGWNHGKFGSGQTVVIP